MLLYVVRPPATLLPDFPWENSMTPSNLRKRLLRFGKWGALALGFGGLCAADAAAEKSELRAFGLDAQSSQNRDAGVGAVLVRLQGGMILVSEQGGAFEPLMLKESRHVEQLRRMLDEAGAAEQPVSVPLGAMIVANGGAAGDANKPKAPDADNGSTKKPPSKKTKKPVNNPGNGK
jgi:hypothetical protein